MVYNHQKDDYGQSKRSLRFEGKKTSIGRFGFTSEPVWLYYVQTNIFCLKISGHYIALSNKVSLEIYLFFAYDR